MKMIGLKNVALSVTDERGSLRSIPIAEGEVVEVPDEWAGTVKAVGYARPLEVENTE